MLEKIEKFIEKQVEEAKDEFDNYINEIQALAKTKIRKLRPSQNYTEEAL